GEGVAVDGGGVLDLLQDPAVNIDNAGGPLGAADVHADRQPHGRLPFTSCPSSRPSAGASPIGVNHWIKPVSTVGGAVRPCRRLVYRPPSGSDSADSLPGRYRSERSTADRLRLIAPNSSAPAALRWRPTWGRVSRAMSRTWSATGASGSVSCLIASAHTSFARGGGEVRLFTWRRTPAASSLRCNVSTRRS